jgi:acyl carrier protein
MGRTLETIKEVLADYRKIDIATIKDEYNLTEDLGLDSLDSVELVIKLEEQFDVELSDNELEGIRSISGLADAIDRKLQK